MTSGAYDCPASGWPSLGLGNTARAEILKGDGWRALKSVHALSGARKYSQSRDPGGRRLESTEIAALRWGGMIHTPTVGPLWGLRNTAGDDILEGDIWRALISLSSVGTVWFKLLLLEYETPAEHFAKRFQHKTVQDMSESLQNI